MPVTDQSTYSEWDTAGKSLVAEVPDYDDVTGGNQTSYLRLGAAIPAFESSLLEGTPGGDTLITGDSPYPGWLEYTDGDRTVVTRSSHREIVGGDKTETISGKYRLNIGAGTQEVYNADPIYKIEFFEQKGVKAAGKSTWRKREMGHNSSDTYTFGDVEEFFGGYKFDAAFGLTNNIFFGGKLDFTLAAGLSINIGYAMDLSLGVKYSRTEGKDLRVAGTVETKAREEIHLRIKTMHTDTGANWKKIGAGVSLVGGSAIAAILAGAGSAGGDVDSDGFAPQAAATIGTAVIPFTVGLVGALVCTLLDKSEVKLSKAEIKVAADGVHIADNNNVTGAPTSWIDVGVMNEQPHIRLKTLANDWIQLQPAGGIVAESPLKIALQMADHQALFRLKPAGMIQFIATQWRLNARLIDIGNVIRVLGG